MEKKVSIIEAAGSMFDIITRFEKQCRCKKE